MPNFFQLLKRTTGEATAFGVIDEEMCAHFGVPVDRVKYYMDWYDIAGFAIATGRNLEKQIQIGEDWISQSPSDEHAMKYLEVLKWLHENYTSDAWVQIGKQV